MSEVIAYGFTLGGILYIISIGFSLTFGSMRIVNFAHGLVYAVGAYALFALLPVAKGNFVIASILAIIASLPVSYIIEKFVIRRLYGKSIDYAIIASYAVLLIGVDLLKWIFGASPVPVSDPIGRNISFMTLDIPLYRVIIILLSFLIFTGLTIFFKKTIIGKIVIAGLGDREAVQSLGIDIDKYFAIVFILGSALASLGGILYGPISTVHPYMGFRIVTLCFAVVIIGGMGNLRGTAVASYSLGMVMAITAWFWGAAADAMVFVVMAIVLIFRPIEI
ncbi:MAG TPA: branched-chain amino acid ABC transporter permease [Syntrophorhabdaceae bacterium]|nr:branched-chain amino acid ABC transporter permease [Syntrophorhabdaceae bacterium]